MEKKTESEVSKKITPLEVDENSWSYNYVEENYDLIYDALVIEDKLSKLIEHLEQNSAYLGAMDRKKVDKKRRELETQKNETLDILISRLSKDVNNLKILNSDQLNVILEHIDDKRDEEEDEEEDVNSEEYEESDDADYEKFFDITNLIKNRIEETKNKTRDSASSDKMDNINIANHREKENSSLAAIRERINSLPGENKNFDPQEELSKIRETARIQASKPEEKRSLIRSYKYELARQMFGIAEMNAHFEKEIFDNGNYDLDQHYSYMKDKAKELKLSSWQINRYEKIFDNLKECMVNVENFWIKNENKAPEEIFSDVFGSRPVGKIEISKEKVSIIFYCYDINDFAKTYFNDKKQDEITNEDIKKVSSYNGFYASFELHELGGAIVVKRHEKDKHDDIKHTIRHEKKHLIDELINKTLSDISLVDEFDKQPDNLIKNAYYEANLNWAQTELFAFFKGEMNTREILRILAKHYFPLLEKGQKKRLKNEYEELVKLSDINITWKEYFRKVLTYKSYLKYAIRNGVRTLNDLESVGFSRNKIIAILQDVRLDFWPKHIFRLESSGYLIQNLKEDIKKQLEYHSETKRELEEKIKENKTRRSWIKRAADYINRGHEFQMARKLKYTINEIEDLKYLLKSLESYDK